MSFRSWVSVVTVVLLVVVLFFARHEIVKAWELLERVNPWIFLLVIPAQVLAYLAGGEMIFSYLRKKGETKHIAPLTQARMALEMNFVNHILPSAGVSGISYMTWRLSKFHISPARATLAQLVRFATSYFAFITLLIISLMVITVDGDINRWVVLFSLLIIGGMLGVTFGGIYFVSSKKRTEWFSRWLVRTVNRVVRVVTFGRKKGAAKVQTVEGFLFEMHTEYLVLRRERSLLIRPYLWGILFTIFEVSIYMVTFWALGFSVNPAPVLIAYGLASMSAVVVVTPGGAGAFEAIMVSFLATAGIQPDAAIAATLLARVATLLGTIGLGYVFYQQALVKYGKRPAA